jgi:hypothetical protein
MVVSRLEGDRVALHVPCYRGTNYRGDESRLQ